MLINVPRNNYLKFTLHIVDDALVKAIFGMHLWWHVRKCCNFPWFWLILADLIWGFILWILVFLNFLGLMFAQLSCTRGTDVCHAVSWITTRDFCSLLILWTELWYRMSWMSNHQLPCNPSYCYHQQFQSPASRYISTLPNTTTSHHPHVRTCGDTKTIFHDYKPTRW